VTAHGDRVRDRKTGARPRNGSAGPPLYVAWAPQYHRLNRDRARCGDMEKTPAGTAVGVDDPYAHVERCDHLTDDGRCRFAVERSGADPGFARERRDDDLRCLAAVEGTPDDPAWAVCPHFRSRDRADECARCGLEEVRMADSGARPLLEEHHLSYADREGSESPGDDGEGGDEDALAHEITVYLCRWCHAKVHGSWARVDDDATPDPEAVAAREERRAREHEEFGFETARDRREE